MIASIIFSLAHDMYKISYADVVSSLALLTALGALGWNIIRDLIMDKVAIDFSTAFGEVGNIKNSITGVFADAGSLPNHKFDNPHMIVRITNSGRRPVGIAGVGGELESGEHISMVVEGLPKILQPYEIFSSMSAAKQNVMDRIINGEITKLWVRDTKNKKWMLSKEGWKHLKETAAYINSKKHL